MYPKEVRQKTIGLMRPMRLLAVLLVPVFTLIMGAAAPLVWARGHFCVLELDEAEVFIEFNSTDDDRGIQFFWDGEPWKWMRVRNESGRAVLSVISQRNVRAQGLTEGFFESAEPTSDELPADEFFARFPEGEYTFWGRTLDGCWLTGEVELTHNLPTPVILDLDGFPFIRWNQPPGGPEVVGYEVVVELVVEENGDERVLVNTATFPGDIYEFSVSPEFVDLIDGAVYAGTLVELKVEVIAREESGNKTITEQEVEVALEE
ncbi:MAG: hypothetical protein PVI06_01005 [Desulfobacterales bacterium]|jgi:hypothetical protein